MAPAFSVLNIAAEIYRELKPASQADDQTRALRNMRKRVREMKTILADADILTPKR